MVPAPKLFAQQLLAYVDCVSGIGNVIQAPGHAVLRANTFSIGQQTTENGQLVTLQLGILATGQHCCYKCVSYGMAIALAPSRSFLSTVRAWEVHKVFREAIFAKIAYF